VPQLPDVVGLVTCTVCELPAGNVNELQLSVWLGAEPVIEQVAGPLWEAIVQLTPDPPGNGSLRVVPVESPGPALLKVMVKPIAEPALTLSASAVLVMVTVGQLTVSEAEAEPEPSLPVAKLAVLL
jgi:hypothetical protein